MQQPTYAAYRRAVTGRPLPLAFVDLDLLEANAAAVVARSGGKPVRVASKSVRSVAVLRRILDADPAFQGLLCFTATEAADLAGAGFEDLVVGYPTWHPDHVRGVAERVAEGHALTLMVDSAEHVAHLQDLAATNGVVLPVCLDLDVSWDLPGLRFGVWRSPVRTPSEALAVAERIAVAPNLRLDGVMAYEAQIAGVPDHAPGYGLKGPVIRRLKAGAVERVARQRAAVVQALRGAGHDLRFVNGGGTGSIETTVAERAVTEVTAGSAFFSPALFDGYDAFTHAPAAGFAVEVVRRPAPGILTCLGGGYVASGAPGPDKIPRPYLPEGATLDANEAAGEVQTPVRYDGPEELGLGDPVFLRHAKAGELCERFTTLLCIRGDEVVDEVSTYRGDGRCYL
jgi:D-serine deaminase-like pyridoxal phosphate-dependent protein